MTWLRQQWDRVVAWVLVGLGVLLLLIGWLGVTDTAYPAEQIPYVVSGGLGGILLAGVGVTLWLSADLRDEWRKLDSIERAINDHPGIISTEEPAEPAQNGSARRAPSRPTRAESRDG